MAKKIARIILIVTVAIGTVGILLVAPLDRRPITEMDFYISMMEMLDTVQIEEHFPVSPLTAGWSRENIVPDFVAPMAGYSPRFGYEEINDPLYVNVIVLNNGNVKVALVSYDLLITPPMLEERLQSRKIPGIDFIYFSASHTHNGIGGWENSLGGQMMSGLFREEILDHLENRTLKAVEQATDNLKESDFNYFEVPASGYVQNRLNPEAPEDGTIRGMEIVNSKGEKAILTVFSAHSTNIDDESLSLSADYPGQFNRNLEDSGYDFAMFMAGAVGSHSLDGVEGESFALIDSAGKRLSSLVKNKKKSDGRSNQLSISFSNITVELGSPQLRLAENLVLRDWAFNALFSPLEGKIKYLEIGKLLFLGMPCDFSGEILINNGIYDLAKSLDKNLIVTSFNGDYIGYITDDRHYDGVNRAEVREMNWVGPYHGKYFSDIIGKLVQRKQDLALTDK